MTTATPTRASIDDLLSAKWAIPILRTLLAGPARFSGLRQAIPGVSANILAARLRSFERAGTVERVRLPAPADRHVYQLTRRGTAAQRVIDAIDGWSRAWEEDAAFDNPEAASRP